MTQEITDNPKVSVVLVLWNCEPFLKPCLDSFKQQTLKDVELVAVDNASGDRSARIFAKELPGSPIVENSSNRGFAGAANQGIAKTRGEFVLLLNPDIVMKPDFLETLVTTLNSAGNRTGWAAPKLLRMDNGQPTTTIDSTGHYLTRARYPHNRGWGEKDSHQYDTETVIFGSCAAASIYRRTMLDNLAINGEVYDADFSSYFEDADLDWRASLAGWKCIHVPEAVAFHERGGSGGEALSRVKKEMIRNHLLLMMKNDRLSMIITDLPYLFLYWSKVLGRMIISPSLISGLLQAIRLFPKMMTKRKQIKHRTTASKQQIRSWFVDISLKEKLSGILLRATGGRHDAR